MIVDCTLTKIEQPTFTFEKLCDVSAVSGSVYVYDGGMQDLKWGEIICGGGGGGPEPGHLAIEDDGISCSCGSQIKFDGNISISFGEGIAYDTTVCSNNKLTLNSSNQ